MKIQLVNSFELCRFAAFSSLCTYFTLQIVYTSSFFYLSIFPFSPFSLVSTHFFAHSQKWHEWQNFEIQGVFLLFPFGHQGPPKKERREYLLLCPEYFWKQNYETHQTLFFENIAVCSVEFHANCFVFFFISSNISIHTNLKKKNKMQFEKLPYWFNWRRRRKKNEYSR